MAKMLICWSFESNSSPPGELTCSSVLDGHGRSRARECVRSVVSWPRAVARRQHSLPETVGQVLAHAAFRPKGESMVGRLALRCSEAGGAGPLQAVLPLGAKCGQNAGGLGTYENKSGPKSGRELFAQARYERAAR